MSASTRCVRRKVPGRYLLVGMLALWSCNPIVPPQTTTDVAVVPSTSQPTTPPASVPEQKPRPPAEPSPLVPRPTWANVDASRNDELISAYGGTYQLKHSVQRLHGEPDDEHFATEKVESCIALASFNGQPMLEINAVSDNDHGCYFDLLASLNTDGQIVLRADTMLYDHEHPETYTCWYLASISRDILELTESWADVTSTAFTRRHARECERPIGFCGAGGHFMGLQFPLRSRNSKKTRCEGFDVLRNR